MVDERHVLAEQEVERRGRVARIGVGVRPPRRAERLRDEDQHRDGHDRGRGEHGPPLGPQPVHRVAQTPRRVSGATLNFQNAKTVIWSSSTPWRQRLMFVSPYVRGW